MGEPLWARRHRAELQRRRAQASQNNSHWLEWDHAFVMSYDALQLRDNPNFRPHEADGEGGA